MKAPQRCRRFAGLNRIKDRAGQVPGRGSAIGGIGLSAVSLVIAF
jgi:hypothetical protein